VRLDQQWVVRREQNRGIRGRRGRWDPGKTMFTILSRELQSVAVRARVRYAPHPFEWMKPAGAHSTRLTIESEGKEVPLDELPPWTEDKIKVLPVVRSVLSPFPPFVYC
jgi:hypothetical protein